MQNEDEDDDGEHGVIINVASVAAFDGQNGQVSYSAAKVSHHLAQQLTHL